MTLCVSWQEIGLDPLDVARVRDVWLHQDLGMMKQRFCASVPPHDVVMVRVFQ